MADVESYSLRSGRDRVVGYLLRARNAKATASPKARVAAPAHQQALIASPQPHAGTLLSRILNELTGAGLIHVEGRTIHIPDIGRLRRSLG